MVSNDYIAADVVVLGSAQAIICGSCKGIVLDDCPNQELRTIVVADTQ